MMLNLEKPKGPMTITSFGFSTKFPPPLIQKFKTTVYTLRTYYHDTKGIKRWHQIINK